MKYRNDTSEVHSMVKPLGDGRQDPHVGWKFVQLFDISNEKLFWPTAVFLVPGHKKVIVFFQQHHN